VQFQQLIVNASVRLFVYERRAFIAEQQLGLPGQ